LIAIDTNIFVYADSPDDSCGRYGLALDLLSQVSKVQNCLPLQVLGEFLNVCRRKKMLEMPAAILRACSYAEIFQTQPTSFEDIEQAGRLSQLFDLQYFDALILTVSRRAGATILLSEDMHDGLEVEGIKVVNPFVAANKTLLADYFSVNN
jgi:predicted nucleic acid-binding protein